MKYLRLTSASVLATSLASAIVYAHGFGFRGGTSILHYGVNVAMSANGENTNAVGHVHMRRNQQGHAHNQRFRVHVANLETNTTYLLWADIEGQGTSVFLSSFQTGTNGVGTVRYRYNGSSQGQGNGVNTMPEILRPVTGVRGVVVTDVNTQAVLVADLTMPDTWHYLVKRPLTNDGVDPNARGGFRLHSNTNLSQFRLHAERLRHSTDYYLAFNGVVSQTNMTTTTGELDISTSLLLPVDALEIRTLNILDQSGASVLSATLP
jgi:hypothetical protein